MHWNPLSSLFMELSPSCPFSSPMPAFWRKEWWSDENEIHFKLNDLKYGWKQFTKSQVSKACNPKRTHYAFVWKLGTVIYYACAPMSSDNSRPIYTSLVIENNHKLVIVQKDLCNSFIEDNNLVSNPPKY